MAISTAPKTLSESAEKERRPSVLPFALLAIGMLIALGFGVWSFYAREATERVVILARDVPAGRQITADDLTAIEVDRYRPQQLAGITDPAHIVGQWAARDLGANDYAQPSMFQAEPPAEPVYPNGRKLTPNMVPVPFSIATVGPITDRDRLNLLFTTDDQKLCDDVTGVHSSAPAGRTFACRFLTDVHILYVEGGTAYLEMTPYQAHAVLALTGEGIALVGERYGLTSDPLTPLDPLDASEITLQEL
ncbi:MAG: hypothetical protein RLZZ387_2529, partial [Chloroflexota bacterium]